jgi:hypothetical protein
MMSDYVRRIGWGVFLLAGGGIGAVMTLAGGMYRIVGHFPSSIGYWLGFSRLLGLGIPAFTLAWLLICAGTFWWGAVCSFALRPQWGWIVLSVACAVSLVFFPVGSGFGVAGLLIAVGWRIYPALISAPR